MNDTSTGTMDSFDNTDISDSEIRSSKPIIVYSTNSSRRRFNDSLKPGDGVPRSIATNISDSEIRRSTPIIIDPTNSSRRRLNDSLEPGDGVTRSIPGGKTLESNTGKILDLDTLHMLFHKILWYEFRIYI